MLIALIGLLFLNVALISSILSKARFTTLKILYFIVGICQIYVYFTYIKPQNFYQIYNITRNFNDKDLKSAYKQVILDYHPDKNPSVSSDQFNFYRNINDVLKSEEKRKKYDTYGVYIETNIDPLPALIYRTKLTRLFFYMILFLIQLVNSQEDKQQQKVMSFLILFLGYGDFYLIENPDIFQKSQFFAQLTLFEFINVYRIIASLIISFQLSIIKGNENYQLKQVSELNKETIEKITKKHIEQIEAQDSKKQQFFNAFLMIALILYSLSAVIDFKTIILDKMNLIKIDL